jgi:3-phenylpropionate/trans-cinnamate dioxygenase ferredoxin reductase subunit
MSEIVSNIVIVGGGQASYQLAISLRDEGYQGRIKIVSNEKWLPYQRPPLSKAFLLDNLDPADVAFSLDQELLKLGIEVELETELDTIDDSEHKILTKVGKSFEYDRLVIATGARNRRIQYDDLKGVCYLRTIDDAKELRSEMQRNDNIVIVGGGFLGLEVAAAARRTGLQVDVIESSDRLIGRGAASATSEALAAFYRSLKVKLHFGRMAVRFNTSGGRLNGVELDNGEIIGTQLALVSVGIIPNVELAQKAGLETPNGILVNDRLQTANPNIFALGDCALFPRSGNVVRLESVQNAVDQARCLAAGLVGKPYSYRAIPWFWSDQAGHRLQIAGLPSHNDHVVIKGEEENLNFSVFSFQSGRLISVDSLNRPADHLAARRCLTANHLPTIDEVSSKDFDFRAWTRERLTAQQPP